MGAMLGQLPACTLIYRIRIHIITSNYTELQCSRLINSFSKGHNVTLSRLSSSRKSREQIKCFGPFFEKVGTMLTFSFEKVAQDYNNFSKYCSGREGNSKSGSAFYTFRLRGWRPYFTKNPVFARNEHRRCESIWL